MNARIAPTKKQRATARDLVRAEIDRQVAAFTRRYLKAMCFVLNNRYGFGKSRLAVAIADISDLLEEYEFDEVFWQHVDMRMDQIGLPFEKEDYEEWDR